MTGRPSPAELWEQAGGDPGRYRDLMREHGHIVKCECPCHLRRKVHCPACKPKLPCGWGWGGAP